ncbi:hypothetical protein [Halothiobacillus sp.]|uniref:hypothetical protein n=1 Tax=Halothiobacillus sp. TaxID=1891311 RepID=UPI002AD44207|nr:hypothetical protein [Halothiobacillus sp.]
MSDIPTNYLSDDVTASRCLPSGHPVFAGHFPAQPIVPGALLLDMVIRHASRQLSVAPNCIRIDQAKFLLPVGPDESIDLSLDEGAGTTSHRFTLRVGDKTVASGTITVMGTIAA